MLSRRRFVGLVATSALTSLVRPAGAQGWPTRYVRIIVPFVPGGATDVIARVMGNRLSETWGQQVVVENRGGAGANIGAQAAAQSDSDGYTLYITSVPHATNRFLYSSLAYDPIADFAPVTLICTQSNIMVVPNSSPAKSVREFITYAKANPGKISYGSGGIGTSVHLSGEHVIFDNITASLPHVKNGAADWRSALPGACRPRRTCRPSRKPAFRGSTSLPGSRCSCRPRRRAPSSAGSTRTPSRRSPIPW
jgi:tripartite-type tricarboxylate transporter receptor subunit TctC